MSARTKAAEQDKETADNAVDEERKAVNEEADKAADEEEPDMVRIKLFKDNGEYKDDLTVGLNGKMYKIQRGVEVEVPKPVYEIIMRSMESDQRTAALISKLESEYEASR